MTGPAVAQDATWSTTPGSGDFNTGANWSPATVPTGTAFFDTSSITALSFSADMSVGGWTFNAGASAYDFTNAQTLQFTGAGIVINGGSATITNSVILDFTGTSTAGSATITNSGDLYFYNTSTAGSAAITNGGTLAFVGTATAGSASITNNNFMQFQNAGTAGSASIINTNFLIFYNTSTAGSATITNSSVLYFTAYSTAGSANIANDFGGLIQIYSSAGSATITNDFGGAITIGGSADRATITNDNGGTLTFFIAGTAGSATIANSGALNFNNTSTAGNAAITNNGTLDFNDTSTAGNAAITNSGTLNFNNTSTAGSVAITNNGNLYFYNTSTAGNAAITNGAAGTTDFSNSTGPLGDHKLIAGSVNGGGTFSLGQNELTVGGNNLSTNVTGAIADGGAGGGTGGSLVKAGTGTLTLSGANTYTGATTVNGGTLAVNGSILTSSSVTVNTGSALAGTGTVGNTLVTGGTFAPGSGTAGSSMTVNGTLGFNAAATYLVNVNPVTASFANVSGVATLGGATVNASFAASNISKQYMILTAGSISGAFGAATNTNLPANFTDAVSYDAHHAYLNLTLAFQSSGASNLNDTQNGVGNALTNYFNTTGGIPLVFAALNANGLSQASGQPGASTTQTGITGMGQFVNGVFDGAFGDNGGQSATGFAEENSYASKPKVSREAKEAYAAVTPRDRRAPVFDARWNVWAAVYGGNSRVNGDTAAGTNTTTSRIFGTVAGASYRFTPDTLAGFALGGAGSSFDVANGYGGGKADVFNMAVYAKHSIGAAYLAGLLGYSWQDTTTDRTVTISGTDKLHASFKAQALAARLEGGWRYATPAVGITPYAALQATTFYLPAYGETATSGSSTFALNYTSKTATATRSEFGTKFDKAILVRGGVFTLKARTAWAHGWNTDRSATATFQTLPGATFTTNGARPAADSALLSLGGEMGWRNGWALAANFDGEFSRTTAGYAGKGTLRYAW